MHQYPSSLRGGGQGVFICLLSLIFCIMLTQNSNFTFAQDYTDVPPDMTKWPYNNTIPGYAWCRVSIDQRTDATPAPYGCKLDGEWLDYPNVVCGEYRGLNYLFMECWRDPPKYQWEMPTPEPDFRTQDREIVDTLCSRMTSIGRGCQYKWHSQRPCDEPRPPKLCPRGKCDLWTFTCLCPDVSWIGLTCEEREIFHWVTHDWTQECNIILDNDDDNNNPEQQQQQPPVCGQSYQTRVVQCRAQSTFQIVDTSYCLGTHNATEGMIDTTLIPEPSAKRPCHADYRPANYPNDGMDEYGYIACHNNGKCGETLGKCQCPLGFFGDLCEVPYTPNWSWGYSLWSEECKPQYDGQICGPLAKTRTARCYDTVMGIAADDNFQYCIDSIGPHGALIDTTQCGVKNNVIRLPGDNKDTILQDGCGLDMTWSIDNNNNNNNNPIPKSGTCIHNNNSNNPQYQCQCADGYTGQYCTEIVKNIKWVATSDWSQCKPRSVTSHTCGRLHRTRNVACYAILDDNDDNNNNQGPKMAMLPDNHPACVAQQDSKLATIDFTTCPIYEDDRCQNGGVCVEKSIATSSTIVNFIANYTSYTFRDLECKCTDGWYGPSCQFSFYPPVSANIEDNLEDNENNNNNENDDGNQQDEQQQPTLSPAGHQIDWFIGDWSNCMVKTKSLGVGTLGDVISSSQQTPNNNNNDNDDNNISNCTPYIRSREVYCYDYTRQEIVEDVSCFFYLNNPENNPYGPTTKPLDIESCFMYWPECPGQEVPQRQDGNGDGGDGVVSWVSRELNNTALVLTPSSAPPIIDDNDDGNNNPPGGGDGTTPPNSDPQDDDSNGSVIHTSFANIAVLLSFVLLLSTMIL